MVTLDEVPFSTVGTNALASFFYSYYKQYENLITVNFHKRSSTIVLTKTQAVDLM